MPYKVVKKGNRWYVVKKTTGKILAGNKTRLTKKRAIQVMKAIYANTKD